MAKGFIWAKYGDPKNGKTMSCKSLLSSSESRSKYLKSEPELLTAGGLFALSVSYMLWISPSTSFNNDVALRQLFSLPWLEGTLSCQVYSSPHPTWPLWSTAETLVGQYECFSLFLLWSSHWVACSHKPFEAPLCPPGSSRHLNLGLANNTIK